MQSDTATFTLDELAGLVDLPRRTVRYYIQIGLIDRPAGVGHGAHYGPRHAEQLVAIKKWQAAGLSLERIRELLAPQGDAGPHGSGAAGRAGEGGGEAPSSRPAGHPAGSARRGGRPGGAAAGDIPSRRLCRSGRR